MSKLAHSNQETMDRIEIDRAFDELHMTRLPARSCGRCRNWTRQNTDDLTAPEGRCGLSEYPGHWPLGYWPATLQRDGCGKFKPEDSR